MRAWGLTWVVVLSGCLTTVEPIADGKCRPSTCAALGKDCGQVSDGCGGLLSCGSCAVNQQCGATIPNVCGCQPLTCAQVGASCGRPADGCGGTLSCGSCPDGASCGGFFTCQVKPETQVCQGTLCIDDPVLTGATLLAVATLGPQEAVAVGEGGVVLHVTPTEVKRELIPTVVGALVDVAAAGPHVWAVSGDDGAVFHRVQGTWVQVPQAEAKPRALHAVAVAGDGRVWAAASDVLLTYDGTAMQVEALPAGSGGIVDLAVGPTTLLVLTVVSPGSSGYRLLTRRLDSSTWNSQGVIDGLYSVDACPDGSAFLSGTYSHEGPYAAHWHEGGQLTDSFPHTFNGGFGVGSAACLGDNTAWGVGPGQLASLTETAKPGLKLAGWPFGVAGTSKDDLWVVGRGAMVVHVVEGVATVVHGARMPGGGALTASSRDNVWRLGDDGKAEHFDGQAWSPQPTGVPETLRGVAVPTGAVWAVGGNTYTEGRVVRGSNAGWELMRPLSGQGISWSQDVPVQVVSDGQGEVLLHTVKVGSPPGSATIQRWVTDHFEKLPASALDASGQLGSGAGRIVGFVSDSSSSQVYTYASGTWSFHSQGPAFLTAVTPAADGVLFASNYSRLLRYASGQWVEGEGTDKASWSVIATSGNEAWAVGASSGYSPNSWGVLAHFDGAGWSMVTLPTSDVATSLAVTATDVWISTQSGLLLHQPR
ncbi:MAG: hypothetical protein K1X89_21450 [Myxococcaceae bacterium]|nr:hypothetical protein [Myxococcaceae bacterium]